MDEMNFQDLLKTLKQIITEVENDGDKPKKERVEYKHIRTDYVDITCLTPVGASTVRKIEKTFPDCNFDNAILSHLLIESLIRLADEIYENGNKSDKNQFKLAMLTAFLFMRDNGWF